MTTDPTHDAEPGRDAPRAWTPSGGNPDTDVLPIFAASAAAVAASSGRGLPDAGAQLGRFDVGRDGARPGERGAGEPGVSEQGGSDPGSSEPGSAPGVSEPGWDQPVPQRQAHVRRRPWALIIVSIAGVLALALAGYLLATTLAYQDRAAWGEEQAREIGTDLATTRTELEGTTAELEAVRVQLVTAQARITALADEKAQVGDDREAQRQLVDYQERVSEAAGTVASALERCVQGQDTLIGYLGNPTAYDPAQLTAFGAEVDRLCASATTANQTLQDELAR